MDRGFKQSKIDSCLYYRKGMIVLTYVDDCIIVGNKMRDIDNFVKSMQNGKENFILTSRSTQTGMSPKSGLQSDLT